MSIIALWMSGLQLSSRGPEGLGRTGTLNPTSVQKSSEAHCPSLKTILSLLIMFLGHSLPPVLAPPSCPGLIVVRVNQVCLPARGLAVPIPCPVEFQAHTVQETEIWVRVKTMGEPTQRYLGDKASVCVRRHSSLSRKFRLSPHVCSEGGLDVLSISGLWVHLYNLCFPGRSHLLCPTKGVCSRWGWTYTYMCPFGLSL